MGGIYYIRCARMVYVTNTLAPSMFEGDGVRIELRKISLDEAREIVRSDEVESFVGHQATAQVLSTLLGIEIPMRRAELKTRSGKLLIFGLNRRLQEGVVLHTLEEINAVGYTLYLATVSPLS